jgi:hypothetical protein
MIKLISSVVFAGAFIWTWFLFNSELKINVSTHAALQSKLAIMIEDTIKAAKPNVMRFQMHSLYTKTLDDNKISAHFSYSYTEGLTEKEKVEQSITGEAVLNRSPSENADDQKWVVQSVKTDSSVIEFQEGSIIGGEPDPKAPRRTNSPPNRHDSTSSRRSGSRACSSC